VTTTDRGGGHPPAHRNLPPLSPGRSGLARAALAEWLAGCPQADEAILVASEFRHQLRPAQRFPARRRVHPARRSPTGPRSDRGWRTAGGRGVRGPQDGRAAACGSMVVAALAGPWELGHRGGCPLACRLGQARRVRRAWPSCHRPQTPRGSPASCRTICGGPFTGTRRYGLWRVVEDDPDSDLYAESSDADTVIGYITAHA